MNYDKLTVRSARQAAPDCQDLSFKYGGYSQPYEPFSLGQLTGVVRRRKWSIVRGIMVGLLLALLASLLMTRKYESTTVLEINKEDSDPLAQGTMSTGVAAAGDMLDHSVTMETHAQELQSDTLALQVIDQLHLESRPEFKWKPSATDSDQIKGEVNLPLDRAPHRRENLLGMFHRNLKVKPVPGSRLISVSYRNPDPVTAAAVSNALVNGYIEQYFLTRYKATAQSSAWLSKQLDDLKRQVEGSQQKLVDYQKKNGILGPDQANNVVMAKLEDLNKQLSEAQGNRITRQVITELVKGGNAELISGLAGNSLYPGGSSASNSLSLLQALRTQEAELKIQYAQAASKFGSAYPKLLEMSNQLNALDSAIQEEIKKVASRAENDYLTALNTETKLRAAFEKQKAEANNLNDKAIQYNILKHEADASSQLYDQLLEKLKSAGILSGLRSSKMVVIDPASPAAEPIRPNVLINHAIGLAAGLLLGISLAFIKEARDNTVRNPDQIEAMTSLPQLGVIPNFRFNSLAAAGMGKRPWKARIGMPPNARPVDLRPLALAAPESTITEAYRQVRSSITLSNLVLPKIILVTSPLSEEGKTTTAINLAIVLAQQGANVLLVDADLRRPSIQARLKMSSDVGLGPILAFQIACDSAIVKYVGQPGLSVLGAGPKSLYPSELLSSKYMTELMEQWRGQFDVVLMDTSPVLSVTDAVVLSSKADAVLLVARSESTTEPSLMRTRDVLRRANANIVGFVVNDVDLNSWDYHQYYG